MTVIIDGTNGITDVDGSAATPALTGTDTNTGIFFPAADTIAFAEGGAEVMRINSSGNVGIGTTSPVTALSVSGAFSFTQIAATPAVGSSFFAPAANTLAFGTNSAERMRIDSSGNVGIGTSSPSYKLQVSGANLYLTNAGNTELMTTNTTGTVTGGIQALSNQSVRVGSITNYPTEIVSNNTVVATATSAGVFQFNSGYGSVATAYGCRAWVNFNGTGTVAIRASGNVSSITDNGTGNYTINFTTAMSDVNYATIGTAWYPSAYQELLNGNSAGTYSTSAVQVYTVNSANGVTLDSPIVNVAVFR